MGSSQNKMGTQKMVPLIFSMAVPAMLSMFINALYNIIDSIFVAQYSQTALTAVNLVFPLQTLVIAIAVGTGVGVNSLIARCLGAQDQEGAESAAEHGLVLAVVSGLFFVILGVFGSRAFLSLFTDKPAVLDQAVQYSGYAVGLSIFLIIQIMTEKIQQSTGNMMIPMCQGILGAVINIILDPLMIFGIGPFPEMGVRGAAIATLIGQFAGMLLGLFALFRMQKSLKIRLRGFRFRRKTIRAVYRVGFPGIVMQSVSAVMIAFMNRVLIGFSETAVNVLGIYFKLQTFIFMPIFGINQGTSPVVGFNYGARNRKRMFDAYRVAVTTASSIMILGMILFQAFPTQMLLLFADRKDPAATAALIDAGVYALRIISTSFLCAGFSIVNLTMFQATGRGTSTLIVSICRQIIVLVPCAWLLGRFYGLHGVWFAFPIAEFVSFVISSFLLHHADRKEFRLLDASTEG